MRKLTVGLFAFVLALAGAACGEEPGGGGGAEGVNALAAAAEKATDAGSSAMTMSMSVDVGGQGFSLEGEGAFDFEKHVGEMTMTMEGDGLPQAVEVEIIIVDEYAYMKMPPELAPGGGWFRTEVASSAGAGANQLGQDPSQYLDFLRGASEGEIEELGTEEIDGVSTTHYEAELQIDKILEQAPDQEAADELKEQLDAFGGEIDAIPADVWIDDDGLPRRMKMTMSVEAGGQTADVDITVDLFDYGLEVDVKPPKKFEEFPAA